MKLYAKRVTLACTAAIVLCGTPLLAQTSVPPSPPAAPDAPPPAPPPPGMNGMGGPRRGNPERRIEMLQRSLNLTPDQTTQVRALFEAERSKMEALRSNTSLSQDERRSQMMAMHAENETKMHAILTPDQASKYDAMETRMREHRGAGDPPQPPVPPQPPSPPTPPGPGL